MAVRYEATESFWDLFDTVCYNLYRHGQCLLEVYLGREESDAAASEAPSSEGTTRLSVVPGWSLRRRPGCVEQQQPGTRDNWRRLDEAALVWIEPARPLLKTLQQTRRDLAVLDKSYGSFMSIRQAQANGYDLKVHKQRLDLLTARATSALGWDGRRLFMDRATSSYRVYRELKFARSWRQLADSTLESLNAALPMTGNPHAPRRLVLEGLPTVEDFTAGMLAVRSGSEGLDSLQLRLLYPRR